MKKLVVFASGFGSNFQSIIQACETKELNAKIVGLICDQANAYAIERAHAHHIPVVLFQRSNFDSKHAMDQAILAQCQTWNPDWLILAGYMRLLSPLMVHAYPRRIVNIHPSLLPKYRGLNAIEQALAHQEREYGITIHYVDEGMDTGDIIVQRSFMVDVLDYDSIKKQVQALEQATYVNVIKSLLEDEHEKSTY
jgi:phosphoribosylglycinamide formyltransferase 1